jgi:hypothetical protein
VIHQIEPVIIRARLDPGLHRKIRAAAEEAVRSFSAEVAYRLQSSFEPGEMARTTSLT